jgi:hypothetical protein
MLAGTQSSAFGLRVVEEVEGCLLLHVASRALSSLLPLLSSSSSTCFAFLEGLPLLLLAPPLLLALGDGCLIL